MGKNVVGKYKTDWYKNTNLKLINKEGVALIKLVLHINLNSHFINIGCELADKLPRNNDDGSPIQYIKLSFWNTLRSIFVHEVYDLLMAKTDQLSEYLESLLT